MSGPDLAPRADPTPDSPTAALARGPGLALALLFITLYLLPLGARPLSSPDETRYAEIAREMLVSGNWVSPHLDGVRYFEKPILGYWLNALSLKVLGLNAFAIRLPQTLATGVTAVLIYLFMRRFSTRGTALLSSLIYLTSLEVLACGTYASLDPLLTLFLTATIMSYMLADQEPQGRRRLLYLALSGAACGAAFLTKGFLAYVVPALVIASYLSSRREWRRLALSGLPPLGISILVALPWSILIALREPDFWRYFVVVEHLRRFAGEAAQHHRPDWYFVALLPALAFPWIYLAPAGTGSIAKASDTVGSLWPFASARSVDGSRPLALVRLLTLWIVAPFLFFSLAQGKLVTYILPCFPPFAMLLAMALRRHIAAPATRTLRVGLLCLLAANALELVALWANDTGYLGLPLFGHGEPLRHALLYLVILAALLLAVGALRSRGGTMLRLAAVAAAVLPVYVLGTVAFPLQAREEVTPVTFLADAAGAIPADAILMASGDEFGALCWYARRSDVYLLLSRTELDYGLSYPDSADRNLDAAGFSRLLESNQGQREILIFGIRDFAPKIADLLPEDATRIDGDRFVLWRLPADSGA